LAVAGTVVVNMWFHDIGRHHAANYEMLEALFAHAAALRAGGGAMFGGRWRKPRLVIAVRDCDEEANEADVRRILLGDVENIWRAVDKSAPAIADVFHLDLVMFPHFTFARPAFDAAVAEFAARFGGVGAAAAAAVAEEGSEPVDMSEFVEYARVIWERLQAPDSPLAGDALDLPTYAAMVRAHTAKGRVDAAAAEMGKRMDALREKVVEMPDRPALASKQFGVEMRAAAVAVMADFDGKFSKLDMDGVARAKAVPVIFQDVASVREVQVWLCRQMQMDSFADEFGALNGSERNFESRARKLEEKYSARFEKDIKECSILLPKIEGIGADDLPIEFVVYKQRLDAVEQEDLEDLRNAMKDEIEDRELSARLSAPPPDASPLRKDNPWVPRIMNAVVFLFNIWNGHRQYSAAVKAQRMTESEAPPTMSF